MSRERKYRWPGMDQKFKPGRMILGVYGLCGHWGVCFTNPERVTCKACRASPRFGHKGARVTQKEDG